MRVRVYVGALLVVAWSGSLAVAQGQKVTTPEQLDKVMKGVGPAFRNANKAVNSAAWADAKKELATARAGVLESQSFWIEYKKDDAVTLNKTALEKIDALDKLISSATPDAAAAGAALKEVGQSCAACHKQYRAQDADNNYILKPGSVEGIK